MKVFNVLFFTLFTSLGVFAQTCQTDVVETAPDENYTDNLNGTISDATTGLMWMKCAYGQTFDSNANTCTGEGLTLTWQEALQTAHGYQFADLNGWRLPNIKELSTLTEKRCVRPAINTDFFPETPSDDFWTSTPSLTTLDSAWVVAFFNSTNSLKPKENFVFARFVRVP